MELTQIVLISLAVIGVLLMLMPLLKKVAAATKTAKDDAALEAVEKGLVLLRTLLEILANNVKQEGGVAPASVKRKVRVAEAQVKARSLADDFKKLIQKLEGRTPQK
jgi:hypothetical protein